MNVNGCSLAFCCIGMEQKGDGRSDSTAEVGWYILGENQEHVGPYVSSELLGEFKFGLRNCCTMENLLQRCGSRCNLGFVCSVA